jgi:DNA polymerase-3 subunit delta'
MINIDLAIKNQPMIFNTLKQSKINNRLSHAYLFYGDNGVGKKDMAYALSCLLYSKTDDIDYDSADVKSILDGNHMNINYIGIDNNKTVISKEQISKLQDEYSKTSLVEGPRIYIVDGIDTASVAAQNSLLKFIEEPQNKEQTIGIFLATEPSNVVSTILSRCSLIHFSSIPFENEKASIMEDGIEELDAILGTLLTNNVFDAKEKIKTHEFVNTKGLFLELLNLKTDKEKVVYFLNNQYFFSDPSNLTMLLKWILAFLEDSIRFNDSSDSLILIPIYDKIKWYSKNKRTSLKDNLNNVLGLFNKLKYNVTPKNIFYELVIMYF